MHFLRQLPTSADLVKIILTREVQKRLRGKRFRNRKPLAQNFSAFDDPEEVFLDPAIMRGLLDHLAINVEELTRRHSGNIHDPKRNVSGHYYPSIDAGRVIGWETSAPREGFRDDALAPYEPNARSTGLKVKSADDGLAPKTTLITLVYRLKYMPDQGWLVFVYSMHPGVSLGIHEGDVTAREGRVFYDLDHPGES